MGRGHNDNICPAHASCDGGSFGGRAPPWPVGHVLLPSRKRATVSNFYWAPRDALGVGKVMSTKRCKFWKERHNACLGSAPKLHTVTVLENRDHKFKSIINLTPSLQAANKRKTSSLTRCSQGLETSHKHWMLASLTWNRVLTVRPKRFRVVILRSENGWKLYK